MRRLYEQNAFGRTARPLKLGDIEMRQNMTRRMRGDRQHQSVRGSKCGLQQLEPDSANRNCPCRASCSGGGYNSPGNMTQRVAEYAGPDSHLLPNDLRRQERPVTRIKFKLDLKGYLASICMIAAATAIGWPLYHGLHLPDPARAPFLADSNVLMLYLLGVLWIAARFSTGAAVLASLLAVAAFDFFFVEPFLRFTVKDQQYIFTFAVMLVTALTISTLTARVRTQADLAHRRERRTQSLLALSRELAAARTTEEILAAAVRHISEVLESRVVVLLGDPNGQLHLKADSLGDGVLDAAEISLAQRALAQGQAAGAASEMSPSAAGIYLPMKTSRGSVGVLGVFRQQPQTPWDAEQRQLVETFASQSAVAVERATLVEEAREAWERVEAEFLRNTLLSGVSHELRTPLAAIMGAASALAQNSNSLSTNDRSELLETLNSEAERMERLITNLLDMTRLESGGLALKKEWQPLAEVVGSTLRHLDRRLRNREVRIDLPPDLPLMHIDGLAVEQVLANLIDNAVEYTPKEAAIEIRGRGTDEGTVVEVADRGPGLPPGTEQRVFQKFFRAAPAEARRGIGLGLAICKGIVEAHGGTISAHNRPDGGTVFRMVFPNDGVPPAMNLSA